MSTILTATEIYVTQFFDDHIGPKFVFHDFQHTRSVVAAVQELADGMQLDLEQREILELSAWFHDLGYDQGYDGHEARGAEYAGQYLAKAGYPAEKTVQVQATILATRMPHQPVDNLGAILCDADMSHLGKKSYWDRCGRIRQELSLTRNVLMTDLEWVDFELKFMRNHRYFTPMAQALYDDRKLKHIRSLQKEKFALDPKSIESVEALRLSDEKPKKKKKKLSGIPADERGSLKLKELDLGRGVETMYKSTYRTHINLSSIADNKANIMLSINAIVISIIVSTLVPKFESNPKLIIPTLFLLTICLTAMVFATLATRPKVTEGKFTREDIAKKRANLLFFGNFYNMKLEDFQWGMTEMIKDSDFLYSSMTKDIYFLGIVLAKKYKLLSYCYTVFMYGLIGSVLCFAAAFLL